MCKLYGISSLEANTHGYKKCNVSGYRIDLKYNTNRQKLIVVVRYFCTSVIDNDKYKSMICNQNKLDEQPQGNANSVLGKNICYD